VNKLIFLCFLAVGCSSVGTHVPTSPPEYVGKLACSAPGINQQACISTSPHPLEKLSICAGKCCKWDIPPSEEEVEGYKFVLSCTEKWCFGEKIWELKDIECVY